MYRVPEQYPLCFWLLLLALLCGVIGASAQEVRINEIFFNPSGVDAPNEYVELRGTPNLPLTNTYFLAVEGDAAGNPGTIQNVFDLTARRLGGNGCLVLLQSSNAYAPHAGAVVLVNSNSAGFGSGASSTIDHRGRGGQTDLENASVTFFLVQSDTVPTTGTDIDSNNDGVPDGPVFEGWTVIDAVGVLDNDGAGDAAYGRINFRRSGAPGNGATVASGTIVPVGFTPSYVGRVANNLNWAAAAWVAADVTGQAPHYTLSPGDTVPFEYEGRALNHVGAPNFGAAAIHGVLVTESDGSTDVQEGAGTDTYTLALNTNPSGNVTLQINAPARAEVSVDGGASFGVTRSIILNDTTPRSVMVRALDDNFVEPSPHILSVTHAVVLTQNANRYPTSTLIAPVDIRVIENEVLVISELKVNPPGTNDFPYEFIELRGTPNAVLSNLFFVAVEGDSGLNPGVATLVLDLTGSRLGASGLLLIAGDGHPYNVPAGTRLALVSELSEGGIGLGNGSITFLLVGTTGDIDAGEDLDVGDNGIMERLPRDAVIMDSVGWSDGDANDIVFTSAVLTQSNGTPDAATRFSYDNTPNSAAAWFNGNLAGNEPESLSYGNRVSAVFPLGTLLSPGAANNTAPTMTRLGPYTGVIDDTTAPPIRFTIGDSETPIEQLVLSVSSSNPEVVPDENLILEGAGAEWTLTILPIGVGYATITVSLSDGVTTLQSSFAYAASADHLGGGRFHTGVSDASSVMAIDANYMIVADDENQILRIYSRSNSGPPFVEMPMDPFLGLTDFYEDGRTKEVDLEGSTRVGDRIYWIGSHSHAQDADVRTNRARIFATDVSGAGTNTALAYRGRYDYLKADLLEWDEENHHGRGANHFGLVESGAIGMDPKDTNGAGFNIEGLCMAPGDTNTAYICFRAPLMPVANRSKALIIPVTNFVALAVSGAAPGAARFGRPFELNLGGRGIRSIEGQGDHYLIVAGPPAIASDVPPNDFRLFTWTGDPADAPQERSTVIRGLIPEGIAELPPLPWTSESPVQLITDSGITVYYNDDVQAKHLPVRAFKKFRSDWFTLGTALSLQPVILSITRESGDCLIVWTSIEGRTYRVQRTSDLRHEAWADVAGDVIATGPQCTKSVPSNASQQLFLRVVALP